MIDGCDGLDLEDIDQDLAQFQQDEYIKEALLKNVDLREYAKEIESQLALAESSNVDETQKVVDSLRDIYNEYSHCDQVLGKMKEMLLGFQADLGGISNEIRHLQQTSKKMTIQVSNRKSVEESLRLYLDKVCIFILHL